MCIPASQTETAKIAANASRTGQGVACISTEELLHSSTYTVEHSPRDCHVHHDPLHNWTCISEDVLAFAVARIGDAEQRSEITWR